MQNPDLNELAAKIMELEQARFEDLARIERLEEEKQLQITNRCLSFAEVAKEAGVSVQKIRQDYHSGKLPARFPIAKRKFHVSDVANYLKGRVVRLPKGKSLC